VDGKTDDEQTVITDVGSSNVENVDSNVDQDQGVSEKFLIYRIPSIGMTCHSIFNNPPKGHSIRGNTVYLL